MKHTKKNPRLIKGPWKGMEPVFVYGTLMTERVNNNRLIRLACEWIDDNALCPGLVIHHVAGVTFPAAIKGDGTALGELWWIPTCNIIALDRAEVCYRRERLLVRGLDTSRTYYAWVYIWDRTHGGLDEEIPSFMRWSPDPQKRTLQHYALKFGRGQIGKRGAAATQTSTYPTQQVFEQEMAWRRGWKR